jgi:hypothetical protein
MRYTEIYKEIYAALQKDSIPTENLNVFARKITDAVWDIKLSIDYGSRFLNTLEAVNTIVNNRFKAGTQDKSVPPV